MILILHAWRNPYFTIYINIFIITIVIIIILLTFQDELACLESKVVSSIRIIWISHPHADHHLGLIRFLSEKRKVMLDNQIIGDRPGGYVNPVFPILLVAPPSVLAFLREYAELIDPSLSLAYIPLSCRLLDPLDKCKTPDDYWLRNSLNQVDVFFWRHSYKIY